MWDGLERYDFLKEVPFLQQRLWGNSVYDYLLALATFVILWLALKTARFLAMKRLELLNHRVHQQHAKDITNFLKKLLYVIHPFSFLILAFYFACLRLEFNSFTNKLFKYVLITVLTIQIVNLLSDFITFLIRRSRMVGRDSNDLAVQNSSQNLIVIAKIILWTVAFLFLLDNFGINVTTFIAGLGIGGIAIALAAQAILGDAFSSFAIALDKPFEVGDFITIDNMMGTVEYIGFKTTRLRSLSGELLVFGNSDLTRSRIRNYKRMSRRRVNFKIGIVYESSLEQIKLVPSLIRQAIEASSSTTFDRAHFFSYDAFALTYDIVYYVESSDYNVYADIQQEINFRLFELFATHKIKMAYPTQTVINRFEQKPVPVTVTT